MTGTQKEPSPPGRPRGKLRRFRQEPPSIPAAFNRGLLEAKSDLVLFVDDDIEPLADLSVAHSSAHAKSADLWATVGQVIQPWQEAAQVTPPRRKMGLYRDHDFPFNSTIDADVANVMAGNLCVNRQRALSIGGFDENFTDSAYRFETEFARRVVNAGGRIRFLGTAGLRHLRAQSGGTRSVGSHLTSASPIHGIGDHYYAMLHGTKREAFRLLPRTHFSRSENAIPFDPSLVDSRETHG